MPGAADPALGINGIHLGNTNCTDYSSPNTATATAVAADHTVLLRVADRNSTRQTGHTTPATGPGWRSPGLYLEFALFCILSVHGSYLQAFHTRGTEPTRSTASRCKLT